MNFPIHDNLGEVNPEQRRRDFRRSATPEEFVQHSQGKTFEQLNSESRPRTIIHQPIPIIVDGGVDKKFRYVEDPTDPGGVIDMLHLMNAAQLPFFSGELVGAAVEVNQWRKGDPSAFQRNDFKSNFLGSVFRTYYLDPNGDLSQQFQEFFTDLKNGELKGIAPAIEYFIADVIDLAKDGYRAGEQLQDIIELHVAHANDSESAQKLRDLMDSLEGFVELPAYARNVEGGFNQATAQGRPPYTDPLVLDLDGDGIELTSVDNHVVRFDVDADGFHEATGWVHSDDGLLVLDRNGDGLINDISELFGNQTTSGFVALRGIDSNADGFIDTADTNFSHLQVWRDLDSDGRSDGNELFTLDELGISRIRTAASSTNITNADNLITETSHFELADGSQREIANVGFSVDQLNSYYDPYSTFSNPVVFTEEILSLPNLRGYGNLPDLQIAIATDEQILTLVRSFTEEMSGDVSSAGERIRSILFRWAGVDGIASTSRGSNVNAQELGFIEKFLGRSYPPNLTITAAAGQTLSQTYEQLASALGTRLIAQVAQVPVEYDASSDQLVFNGDTNAALLQLEQVIAQSVSSPSAQLNLEISLLKQFIGEREEWILGSGSSEQLVDSTGEDRLYGFSGNDTLSASGGNDFLDGGEGNDTLAGGVGSDTLIGGEGNDSLNGGEGNDTYRFTRGDGQDVINVLYQPYYMYDGGTDTLVFGEGITRADLSWSFDGTNLTWTVAGSGDQVTIRNITDTRQQIEQFVIEGETFSLNQVLTNWVGTATAGADNLTWNQSAIFLDGLAGNDTITAGNYADKLYGGEGNDTLSANGGNDTIESGEGNDSLNGGVGSDTLIGGEGNDSLNGGEGNDTYRFTRGDGQDVIHDFYQPYYIEPGGTDTLVFDGGITKADLSWSFDGTNLTFTVAGSSDQVTIRSITDTRHQVEQFVIGGETLSLNEILTSWVGTGTAGADNLTWGQSAIVLDGLAGDDTITTGNYADKLYGGAGDDTLNGGAGDDSVNGGDGNDQIWVSQGNDTVDGGAGSDRLFWNLGNQTTDLVVDNPTTGIALAGSITSRNIEQFTIIGGSGNDRLVQAGLVNGVVVRGSDSFDGSAGNDTLNLGLGVGDSAGGADGDDLLLLDYSVGDIGIGMTFSASAPYPSNEASGSASRLTTTGEILDSITFSGINRFQITGTSKAETISTWNGNDTIDGGAGNDSLHGSFGSDTLDGGDGDDYLRSMYGDDITWTFNGQSVSYSYSGGEDTSNLLLGGAGNDTLLGSLGADTLSGGIGNDSLHGHLGNDSLTGGDGQDSLDGSVGNDTLDGGDGNDTLNGSLGFDSLLGGAGNDFLNGDFGSDTLDGGDGDDLLWAIILDPGYGENDNHLLIGGAGNDTLNASFGNDTLDGGSENDSLNGSFGNDSLTGGDGNDTLHGGSGNDTYFVDSTGDVVTETSTTTTEIDSVTATISYTLGTNLENLILGGSTALNGTGNGLNNLITGNGANNLLGGGDGNDSLLGGHGTDTLLGGLGNDTLLGGLGDDLLAGGAGNDVLTGNEGSDRFLYDTNAVFSASAIGIDQISDFLINTDKIVLDKTTFTALTSIAGSGFSVEGEFAVVASDAAAATTEALIAYSSATGNLFYNQDRVAAGLGSGGQFANLTNIPRVTTADFIIQV